MINKNLKYIDLSSNKIEHIDTNKLNDINFVDITDNIAVCADSDSDSSIHIQTLYGGSDNDADDDDGDDLYGGALNNFSGFVPNYDLNDMQSNNEDDFVQIDVSDVASANATEISSMLNLDDYTNRITRSENNKRVGIKEPDVLRISHPTLQDYYNRNMQTSQMLIPKVEPINTKKTRVELRWVG